MTNGFITAHEAAQSLNVHSEDAELYVFVTAANYPTLHRAFEAISHDTGFSAGHESYSVPKKWSDYLGHIELCLRCLTEEEFEEFVIGEENRRKEYLSVVHQLIPADMLLGDFFNDWEIA